MQRPALVLASVLLLMCVVCTRAATPDWNAVDANLGRKGSEQPGNIRKYAFPRSDLNISVDGVRIKPALALGGWIAFAPTDRGAMLMGDLVLTESELSPVMARIIADGLEVTAIHNHLIRTTLPVFYMHVGGHGDPVRLAESLRSALALSATPMTPSQRAPVAPIDLDTTALDRALGYRGTVNGGVYQFSVPRAETVSEAGMPIPPAMGLGTAVNFQPLGAGKAAVSGDFVLLGGEVNPVLRALRQHGIEVTALHSHMIDETPRLYFMHFWAHDDASKLAQALHDALALMNVKRS